MHDVLHIRLTTTLLVLTLAQCCYSVDPYRNYWYSPYGQSDYGRQYGGDNLGKLTMAQCSRFCSDSSACRAYQFHKIDGRLGTCYTFPDLTYNTIMIPAPGHKYFEKRSCFEVVHLTAAIFYSTEERLILFSGDKSYIFDVIISANLLTFRRIYLRYHGNFFPGLTGTVDGAFLGPSNFTFIIQGTTVKCYELVNVNNMVFEECGAIYAAMLSILDPYFAAQPYLDAIVTVDSSNNAHVITDNIVYRLAWSNTDTEFIIVDSFPLTDTGARNIWSKAPSGITAMSRLINADDYLTIEDYKVIVYNADRKKHTGITFLCSS